MVYSIASFSGKVFSLVGFSREVFSLVGVSDRVCSVAKLSVMILREGSFGKHPPGGMI